MLSDEYAVIRRMTFIADDEFDATQMASDEFMTKVGKDDEKLQIYAVEIPDVSKESRLEHATGT